MKSQRWLWSSVVAVGIAATLSAQTPKPTFEVATVRPQIGTPTSFAGMLRGGYGVRAGGVFNPTHTTVESLIAFAYERKWYQIVDGPDWARRDRFEINARAGGDVPTEQIRLMVQSLLETRFKLVTHTEQHTMRYLALVPAHADGSLGPYIRRSDAACREGSDAGETKQFPPRPETARGGFMRAGCTELSRLVDTLSLFLETPVLDKTGLSGRFTYDMRWESSGRPNALDLLTGSNAFAGALEEQLGLRLKAERGPIDLLVIDSVQQPAEN